MKPLLVRVGGVNVTLYFILLCLSSILLTYAGKTLLISEDLYFQFFGDQLSYERITQIISIQEKWEWTSYVFVPIYYVVKIFLVSICIYIGAIIIAVDISFKKICQMALVGRSCLSRSRHFQIVLVHLRPNGLHLIRYSNVLPAICTKLFRS